MDDSKWNKNPQLKNFKLKQMKNKKFLMEEINKKK